MLAEVWQSRIYSQHVQTNSYLRAATPDTTTIAAPTQEHINKQIYRENVKHNAHNVQVFMNRAVKHEETAKEQAVLAEELKQLAVSILFASINDK